MIFDSRNEVQNLICRILKNGVMKKTNFLIGALTALFFAFGMLSMNQDYNPYFIARQGDSPAVGTKAPELAYENTEGKKVKLSSLK